MAMQGGSSLNFGYFCHDGANCFLGRSSRTATGWTVGAEFEYGIWKNVSLKAEYLYVDLGGGDTNVRAQDAPSPLLQLASFTASHSPTIFNVARIGLNIKLGE
jgi:outer membrane immunogenic protein